MDGDSRDYIKELDIKARHMEHDDSTIFQSSWIRRNPVLASECDWQSVARQFRYVLYCGAILWSIHWITMAIFA